jgi:hypothetical protein
MVRLVLLSGFLGAGKTTTMLAAARQYDAQGRKVAVITNDQAAELVDTTLARSAVDEVEEISGGCFCCRFEDLEAAVKRLVDDTGVEVVIAEAVGSCTDLQATVVRPLRRWYGDALEVAPVTTIVDPDRLRRLAGDESDLGYLFAKQLADGDIIALNKLDLYDAGLLAAVGAELARGFPAARVLTYSAVTHTGLAGLMTAWESPAGTEADLDIDYDRYAAAEAALAWLNHTVVLTGSRFSPQEWAERALAAISAECARHAYLVGHAKVVVESSAGLVKLSLTEAGQPARSDVSAAGEVDAASATFNLRVNCEPVALDDLVRRAALMAGDAVGAVVSSTSGSAFQPSYPRPTHRIAASQDT